MTCVRSIRSHAVWLVLLVALLAPGRPIGAQLAARKPVVLFGPREAERLRYTDGELQKVRRTRSMSSGPHIVIQRPEVKETSLGHTIETGAPTDLFVAFEPNRSPVDMGSLQIRAKKGFFSKSLIGVLKPYIRGTALQGHGIEVPEGRFLIEIEIADRDGATTVETYTLKVAQP